MRRTRCRSCNAEVITALDDLGIEVTLEPTALSASGEALAIVMLGRRTWRIAPPNTKRNVREVWKRTALTIGHDTRGGTLHANHVCDSPLPAAWAAPAPPPPPTPPQEVPF